MKRTSSEMQFQLTIEIGGDTVRSASDLSRAVKAASEEVFTLFCARPFCADERPIFVEGRRVGHWSVTDEGPR